MSLDVEASKNLMRTHAKACYPYECCGLIYKKGNKQEVICGRNIATDPRHNFMLHPEDYGVAEDAGELLAIYHSHCDHPPEPSDADKMLAEKQNLPVIIVSLPADEWSIYRPVGWKPDLVGRPFVYGVMDCLTLAQDYYLEKHGFVTLHPDFHYEPDWWHKGKNYYLDNLKRHGFRLVDASYIQASDLILMQLDSPVSNHCAIYIGDGMMLHHPPTHLSGIHPYICERGYYAKCTTGFYRHERFL